MRSLESAFPPSRLPPLVGRWMAIDGDPDVLRKVLPLTQGEVGISGKALVGVIPPPLIPFSLWRSLIPSGLPLLVGLRGRQRGGAVTRGGGSTMAFVKPASMLLGHGAL